MTKKDFFLKLSEGFENPSIVLLQYGPYRYQVSIVTSATLRSDNKKDIELKSVRATKVHEKSIKLKEKYEKWLSQYKDQLYGIV